MPDNNEPSLEDLDGGFIPGSELEDLELGDDSQEDVTKPDAEEKYIDIFGEKYKEEEAKEIFSKGKNATQRWQEAAEMKRQAEQVMRQAQIADSFEKAIQQHGPEKVLSEIAKVYNVALPTQQDNHSVQSVPFEDLSDEGRYLANENKELKGELAQLKNTLGSTLKEFESYIQEQKGMDSATQVAQTLKSEYGVDITPAELKEAAQRTGIADLEAAWLKENKQKLKDGFFKAGHEQGKREKPNSPSGQSREFDTKGKSADYIFNMLNKGFIPKTSE